MAPTPIKYNFWLICKIHSNIKCVQNWANYLITITLSAGRLSFLIIFRHLQTHTPIAAAIDYFRAKQRHKTCLKAFLFVAFMLITNTRRIHLTPQRSTEPLRFCCCCCCCYGCCCFQFIVICARCNAFQK